MIFYDYGDYHLGFMWQLSGSTMPLAAVFALPTALQAVVWRWLMDHFEGQEGWNGMGASMMWTAVYVMLGLLLGFRTNKAYARFWEGMTLVQQMRAEWFESCSNLLAFSNLPLAARPNDQTVLSMVNEFQFTLVRLMSFMHGSALRQIGGNCEEFDVLDVHGLDDESMEYLTDFCTLHEINRVEVLLHWIQVLITDNIALGVLIVPPPILTRAFQTLSRGMVNLHDVRKLVDIPFPFPLSQMIVALLLFQSVLTPIIIAANVSSWLWAALISFLPLFGMWSVTFIAGQLEQPFGQDANDLPLSNLQFEMNNSLLMLLDDCTKRPPRLKETAVRTVEQLREGFGDPGSRTDSFQTVFGGAPRCSLTKRSRLIFSSQFSSVGNSVASSPLGSVKDSNSEQSERALSWGNEADVASGDGSEAMGPGEAKPGNHRELSPQAQASNAEDAYNYDSTPSPAVVLSSTSISRATTPASPRPGHAQAKGFDGAGPSSPREVPHPTGSREESPGSLPESLRGVMFNGRSNGVHVHGMQEPNTLVRTHRQDQGLMNGRQESPAGNRGPRTSQLLYHQTPQRGATRLTPIEYSPQSEWLPPEPPHKEGEHKAEASSKHRGRSTGDTPPPAISNLTTRGFDIMPAPLAGVSRGPRGGHAADWHPGLDDDDTIPPEPEALRLSVREASRPSQTNGSSHGGS